MFKKIFIHLIFLIFIVPLNCFAIPLLQIYIEKSTYDPQTESWLTTQNQFVLWVMGNISGPGSKGNIYDVYLSIAYPSSESGSISITPTYASSPITDLSLPSNPSLDSHGNGTPVPTGDGSPLPSHGIYGSGVSWDRYKIGDFTLTDSPVADLINSFPAYPGNAWIENSGQINAYLIEIYGFSWVHFDAFNHYYNPDPNHYHATFVPFSHDSSAVVPEPATLLFLGAGLIGMGGFIRRRFKK